MFACCCSKSNVEETLNTPLVASQEPSTLEIRHDNSADAYAPPNQTNRQPLKSGDQRTNRYSEKKEPKHGTKQYELHHKIKATLSSGQSNVRSIIRLPPGESMEEWLSVNIMCFYNDLSMLFGVIAQELCTPETCPVMSAGPKYTYLWADGVKIKKPIKVPACEYIELLLEWVDGQLSDERKFPVTGETPFPPDFMPMCKNIFKRLFRVYAHIYHSHFSQFVNLQASAHLNTCFKRFVFFVIEFDLVDRSVLSPLQQLISSLEKDSPPISA